MNDVLTVTCMIGVISILIILATYCVIRLDCDQERPYTVKGRVKAKIKELENELKYFEKLLVDTRLENLEKSKDDYNGMVKKYSNDVKYCKIEINLLKGLL